MQVVVKKATRSQKSIDSHLVKDMREVGGERTSVSSRIADVDELICSGLGVSKAILESVIFCHQEESLWPMSEPSALKKRFDDIFEAVKYTKVIENIKVLRKDHSAKLKLLEKDQEITKTEKNRGLAAEKDMLKLQGDVERLKDESKDLNEARQQLKTQHTEAWKKNENLKNVRAQVTSKRERYEEKQDSVQKLRRNLKEYAESDEELQSMLEQYQERVGSLQQSVEEEKLRYNGLSKENQKTRDALSAKEREMGGLENQQKSYERQIESREQLIKQTARRHNMRGFDLEIDNEQVELFMDKITRLSREQNANFEKSRRETQQELHQAQGVLNGINEKKTVINQQKDAARSTIASNDRRVGQFQADVDRIDIDEGGKATLESSILDVKSRLDRSKTDFQSAAWDNVANDAEQKLQALDLRREKLDTEAFEANKRAKDTARLDLLNKDLKDRQQSLDTMTRAHGEKVNAVIGGQWSASSLESEFQQAINRAKSRVEEPTKQRNGTAREHEQLNFKLNACRTDLKRKQSEQRQAEKIVREAMEDTNDDPSDFPERLARLEEESDIVKTDTSKESATKDYFKECAKTARDHKVCRLCRRGFGSDQRALQDFINRLEKELNREINQEYEASVQQLEEEVKVARAAKSSYDTWHSLSITDIPNLEAEEARLSSRHEELVSELEQHDQTVSEREEELRDVESLSKTVQNIVKYNTDIVNYERQINELVASQAAAGTSRGLEMIQDDQKSVNEQSKTAKVTLNKIVADRDRAKEAINAMELELRDMQSRLSTATFQLEKKIGLEKQIDELRSATREQRETIRSLDQQLQGLAPELSQAQVQYDDIARRGAEKDRRLQEETSGLNDSLNKLQNANREIDHYIRKGGPEQISQTRSSMEQLSATQASIEKEMNDITREVKTIESQLRNVDETKRHITDNQDYRQDKRALDALSAEIEELESHDIENEYQHWSRESERLAREVQKNDVQQSGILAQIKEKDVNLTKLMATYDLEYKNASYKHREAHIKVETTKAAVEDLGRYAGALDKAIMKYHSLKMEEINRIIDELWRRTYQGTDVDTILIKSDSEASKGNKTYNYRVCMIKQDAEMDMRGRCSAGQKVLASIIIRLALAECFGVNCGLIALDEPTTNLDRDNIRALAESLAEIIRIRRQQSNFQLVVITHDEDFLKYMRCEDFADEYFRVSRNAAQHSIIERQQIANVL